LRIVQLRESGNAAFFLTVTDYLRREYLHDCTLLSNYSNTRTKYKPSFE